MELARNTKVQDLIKVQWKRFCYFMLKFFDLTLQHRQTPHKLVF